MEFGQYSTGFPEAVVAVARTQRPFIDAPFPVISANGVHPAFAN